MKRIIIISIFLLGGILSHAQKINQLDSNGKRHGIWKKNHQNGRIRYQGTFDHGKEIGTFKFYSILSSDKPIITKEFNKTTQKAITKFYTDEGKIESEGVLDGKKRIGKWIYYHKDGKTIMQEEHYVDGKLNGEYKTYFANGKPTIISHYKNGVLNGNYKRYAIKGHLYQDLTYVNGTLNGEAIYYNRSTGELQKKGTFKNDERIGIWQFNIDGELVDVNEEKKRKK